MTCYWCTYCKIMVDESVGLYHRLYCEFAKERGLKTMDFNKEEAIRHQQAIRHPQAIRYDILDPTFLEIMAKIADYGAKTYGDYNWHKSRLDGEKGPINHIYKHLTAYRLNKSYDHLEIGSDCKIHLAAIAFNAMMEFWYETNQQNTEPPTLPTSSGSTDNVVTTRLVQEGNS